MITAAEFIEKVKIPLAEGWGYIYGTAGTLWTKARQQSAARPQTIRYGAQWVGRMVTDCSGLVRWALRQLGGDIVHHARYQYTDWCSRKGQLSGGRRTDGQPLLPGSLVFLRGSQDKIHHVGVYAGNGVCIEARGTKYGVVTSSPSRWDCWGELKMVDYADAAALETGDTVPAPSAPGEDAAAPETGNTAPVSSPPGDTDAGTAVRAIVNNPNTWLNVRSGPGTNYPVLFRVQKGTEAEVLARYPSHGADSPDPPPGEAWCRIRHEGRTGWAAAKYLSFPDAPSD